MDNFFTLVKIGYVFQIPNFESREHAFSKFLNKLLSRYNSNFQGIEHFVLTIRWQIDMFEE